MKELKDWREFAPSPDEEWNERVGDVVKGYRMRVSICFGYQTLEVFIEFLGTIHVFYRRGSMRCRMRAGLYGNAMRRDKSSLLFPLTSGLYVGTR
jgi:hypothetical protein